MPADPNRQSDFWQELKRRKVTRVITVYAAAAFVILEAVDIIFPRLGLPDWTVTLVIFLLAIGLIISVILSWIYDIHPEGGIVKTKPAHKVEPGEDYSPSNSWKIASYISFVVIVGLIVLNIIPRAKRDRTPEVLDKSIAVLPFRNESSDESNTYFINGIMESILDNLCRIKELRVPARTSVEQYRDAARPIPEIAGELKVSYILEGSGQKIGNRILLTIQLIEGSSDQHLWSRQYDRVINKVEDQIDLQSEIAQLVAGEIKATITPLEKELIENIPTTNTIAYEFYQRGIDEYWKNRSMDPESIKGAEDLFRYALDYDSTLAQAYAGMARIYIDLNVSSESYFSEDFLDTVLILADKALSFDPRLSDAYSIKGDYYSETGTVDQALIYYDKALELNPNDWSAFRGKAYLYFNDDLLKTIDNFSQAISRYHGPELSRIYGNLGYTYYAAGIMEKGDSIFREVLRISGDSGRYFTGLRLREFMVGNTEGEAEVVERALATDTSNANLYYSLASIYSKTGQFEKAALYWDRFIERLETAGRIVTNEMHRAGYAYWMSGDREKGAYYLNLQKEYCEDAISLGRWYAGLLYLNYDLAGVYAFLGERDKAYENLRIFNQREKMPLWMASMIKQDPLFDSIRDEPEFQQIIRDVEAKYLAEHERVRQWLEENGML